MPDDQQARDAQAVAEMDSDITVEHIASVYAEALLGAAENNGGAESLLEEFDSLVSDVLDRFPAFEEILASSLISHEETVGVLDRTLGLQASPLLGNFLKVLSAHGRLGCLRAIHKQARQQYERMRGRVAVRVTTASPIGGELAERIAAALRRVAGGQPILEQTVDPKLIGGVVVRVGDTVLDGSVATQLENMRQQMIHRSAHEIQSRRDRFRHPA